MTTLPVLPFEMYSGGFSIYEDLSNEFSILFQRRFLPCSCHLFQRCSAVCGAQVGGGQLCLWNRQSTSLRPQTVLGSAREPAEFCLGEVIAVPHALPFSSCRELGNGDVTPRPPSPRAAVLHLIVLLLSCPEEGGLASQAHCGIPVLPPLRPTLP